MSDFRVSGRPGGSDEYGVGKNDLLKYGGIALAAVAVAFGIFFWFFWRIEVGKGEFAPLLKKTGKEIANEDVLALSTDFKGPQSEFLQEGRHFRNPLIWYWDDPKPVTVIDKLKVGVLVRRFGEPLAPDQIVVENDKQKGILADTRGPGRHYINTWAYDVQIHDMVKIKPGFRGVVTHKVGKIPAEANVFVVAAGERGTQPFLLKAGTHPDYSNPYLFEVTPVDVRSQKFEMAGKNGITFPSKYGFDIKVEGTIEWAPDIKKLPELFVKYVDEADMKESGGINNIQRKVILPFARSYFRTIGGRYRAVDYITGDTRIRVQNEVEKYLAQDCAREGINIKSFVIRATDPPRQIRDQYERREIARLDIDRFEKEVEREIGSVVLEGGTPKLDPDGKPELDVRGQPILVGGTPKQGPDGEVLLQGGRLSKVIEERRKDRENKLGRVREQIVAVVRDAERYRAVEVTKGRRDLEVAKIELDAAKDLAAKARAEGHAAAEVTVMKHKAEAEAVKAKIGAFGEGEKYAEYQLIIKFSPGIRRILSNTDGLFADLFERFGNIGQAGKD